MTALTESLAAKHDVLVELMMHTHNRKLGTPESEVRQFIEGFVSVMTAAAGGDLGPRDEYLASVIPAIRDGGMPLGFVIDGMIRVAMGTAAVIDREHQRWITDFCADYAQEIIRLWEER